MSPITVLLALASLSNDITAVEPGARSTITGVVREALSGKLLSDVKVTVGDVTASTDAEGRFVLSVPVGASHLLVRRDGYLEFQYPLLNIRAESLIAEIDLRTNPLAPQMYTSNGFVPFLCVIDAPDRLAVRHSCSRKDFPGDHTRIIKHNPWNPYFGEAGDRGGVMLITRAVKG